MTATITKAHATRKPRTTKAKAPSVEPTPTMHGPATDPLEAQAAALLSTLTALRMSGLNVRSASDLLVFLYLAARPSATMHDLSTFVGVSGGNISALVDKMYTQGFISRIEDPTDRRRKVIALTDASRAHLSAILS